MNNKQNEQLLEQVKSHLRLQYQKFLNKLKPLPFELLVNHAFNLYVRQDILDVFCVGNNYNIDDECLKKILLNPKSLEDLFNEYSVYIGDTNYEALTTCIRNVADNYKQQGIER